MFAPFPLWIALKYLRSTKNKHSFSFISLVAILGLGISVALMIIAVSVLNGFNEQLQNKILGSISHIQINKFNKEKNLQSLLTSLKEYKEVKEVVPYNSIYGLAIYKNSFSKVLIEGMHLFDISKVSRITHNIISGDLNRIHENWNIAIGKSLSDKLKVSLGEKITFMTPNVDVTAVGIYPRSKRFTVVAIFDTGANDIDSSLIVSNLSSLSKFEKFKENNYKSLRISLHDIFKSHQLSQVLSKTLGSDFYIFDWTQSYGFLYNAILKEKSMVFVLLFLLLSLSSFNVASTMVMNVKSKSSHIAIFRTFGFQRKLILKIFFLQGILISFVGILLGSLFGIFFSYCIGDVVSFLEKVFHFKVLNPDIYFISTVPSSIVISDVFFIILGALFITFVASIYPSFNSTKIQPAQVLRYE